MVELREIVNYIKMEQILEKLLQPDNASIQQGTQELKEAFKSPEAVPALCQLIATSSNPQIRQSAAVILRKRLSRNRNWSKLSAECKNGIKQTLLHALVNEPDKLVKNCIVQFIGAIGKHEFPNNQWPEVFQFVNTLCSSDNPADKELGLYTLSIMTEMCPEEYMNHAEAFAFLFTNTLNNLQDLRSPIAYYTILTMLHFVPFISDNQTMVNTYHQLLPRIMECIKVMSRTDEKHACETMEILDELLESAITVIVPHVKPLIEMCIQLARDKEVDESVKIKAVNFIGWLTRIKKKMITKNGLVEPIVNTLFQLLSLPPDDDSEEEYFTAEPDNSTPMTCAAQTLDILALNLPPEKLIPPLLCYIDPALQGNDLYAKKAAYLAIAVLAEGCADCIRSNYLKIFLQCICKGITDPNAVVRNAALFALGQFSEHLQPDISMYASELLPLLFDFLGQLCTQLQNSKEPPSIDRMFYALEMFCENLEDELLPYLDTLMERLFLVLKTGTSVHLRELALSAIGSTANAAKENLLPYFPRVIEILRVYLSNKYDDETRCLQVQAVGTLGVLARTIGTDNFLPLAQESLQIGLRLMNEADDPDLRKSTYGLFSSIATVISDDISPALPRIIEVMLEAIKSSDGFVTKFKDEDTSGLDVYGDLSDSNDEESIGSETSEESEGEGIGYDVENSYIEEKEEACLALREFAIHCRQAFLPYLETCFEEVFKLTNYPQEDIRKATIETLLQFCLCLAKINTPEGKQALYKGLQVFIPKCAELIKTDDERAVVMAALDAYGELLTELKADVFVGEGHREAIMNGVIDVMNSRTECQDQDQDPNCTDDPEAEHDELLIESAGDIIPKFGKALTPDDFVVYFNNLLTLFLIRMKPENSVAQRSFAVGTLAECMEPLQQYAGKFVQQLLPILLKGTSDEHEEIRNNSVFALGEMVYHGKEALFPHFQEILQTLSTAVSYESHARTLDNICGALARMIIVNVNAIPMEEVFPVLVRYLPLREDFDENKMLFKCLSHLYQMGHSVLLQQLGALVKVAATVIHNSQWSDDETKYLVVNFVKIVQRDFPEEFNNVVSTISQEESASLQQVFNT